jgi:phospholipase/carboxylesterase
MAELKATRWGPADGGAPKQLVVLCHGVGANGQDLIDLAPYWAKTLPQAAFAAPDAPEPYDGAPFGRQWWSLTDRTQARMEAGAAAAKPYLDSFIDAELARLGLPADAYALMGFSQGAMMVLYTGFYRPAAPRAILAYSGGLIAPERLATRSNSAPVLLVHGEADEVVPPFRSRDAATALKAAGIPVETAFRPGVGHSIEPTGLDIGAAALAHGFGL